MSKYLEAFSSSGVLPKARYVIEFMPGESKGVSLYEIVNGKVYDSWYATLKIAKAVAEEDYGIQEFQWIPTNDPPLSRIQTPEEKSLAEHAKKLLRDHFNKKNKDEM